MLSFVSALRFGAAEPMLAVAASAAASTPKAAIIDRALDLMRLLLVEYLD